VQKEKKKNPMDATKDNTTQKPFQSYFMGIRESFLLARGTTSKFSYKMTTDSKYDMSV
jgi:hypothetical protein